ncbi:hypothetical protein [Mesorhizobium sp. Cs1321R2N1]|uniref:hypothetical protein n=1 Tax=Mesorhizobium sp. Cs1321R2N1 TaxID=3015174 RepID=UPI00301BF833
METVFDDLTRAVKVPLITHAKRFAPVAAALALSTVFALAKAPSFPGDKRRCDGCLSGW